MKKSKVVSFEREAEFYFDLGYKYIQSGKLKTALRYVEKAVKAKPHDGFIQFNYAGILSELGDIERSTQVLLHIVNEIDPHYAECYFGLGCNFLQMQKIKKAIENFTLYLENDELGEFAEEAQDLLDMLEMIDDANNGLDDEELEKIYKIEEEAIKHLESREYDKAAKKFEAVVDVLSNAIPARNNLSLAYYYQGHIDKAIDIAKEVLKYEEYNVHANCNLAIFYNKLNIFNLVEMQVKKIRELSTDNEEYLFKIGDTFSSLSKHVDAYKTYKKLIGIVDNNPMYIHFAAIAAYNSKQYKQALRLWQKLKIVDDESFLPEYYIEYCMRTIEDEQEKSSLVYIYQLPKEEIALRIDKIYKFIGMDRKNSVEAIKNDEELKKVLYFGMNFDRNVLRKLIYDKLKKDNIVEAEDIIRKFMLRQEVENYIKIESVFLLNKLGVKEPYSININGEIKDVTIDPLSLPQSEWKKEWEDVKLKAYEMMKGAYRSPYKKIIEDIWYDFIRTAYPNVPSVQKVEVWAAALEYAYCRLCTKDITQQQIADKYNISKSSLGEKYRIISGLLANKLGGAR